MAITHPHFQGLMLAVFFCLQLALHAQQQPQQANVPQMRFTGSTRATHWTTIRSLAINRYPEFIQAWAVVKLAAACANADVGTRSKDKLAAIEESSAGRVVDILMDCDGPRVTSDNLITISIPGGIPCPPPTI